MSGERQTVAYWPPGFIERAEREALSIVAKDTAPDVIAKLREQLPAMFSDALTGDSIGLPTASVRYLTGLLESVLAACVKSVTVTTEGTVTVVDHRTPTKERP